MKLKKIYTLVAAIVMLTFQGCEIEEKLYGVINDTNYWQTEQHIREAINGAYGRLSLPFNGLSIFGWVVEDGGADYYVGAYEPVFSTYTNWSSTNPSAIGWGIYRYFWNEIAYLNKALDKIPEIDMPEARKTYYRAEARALRGFVYFQLAQWFGGVPMVTSSTENRLVIPKEPVEKIYEFVEKELGEAATDLPTKEALIAGGEVEYVRLTKGAVTGLLARTYLVQKKYDRCLAECRKLVEEQDKYGKYELIRDDYKSIFSTKGFKNREAIWSLATNGVNNASMLQVYLYKLWDVEGKNIVRDPSYDVYVNWNGGIGVKKSFYDAFPNDLRKQACLMYSEHCNADVAMVTKFPADTPDGMNSATDIPMLRYADVLLMYAESYLLGSSPNLAKAVESVNLIRDRAGAATYNAADYTAETFKEKIYEERRWELFFEMCGKRDMLRFDKLLDHIAATSRDAGVTSQDYYKKYYLLPFPISALDANPALVQNPGYIN